MRNATEIANQATYTFLANGDLSIEGAAVIHKNFSGKPTEFNPAGGKRTFCVVVPQEVADHLVDQGWNVKHRMPRDEGDDELFFTEIVVNLDSMYPPKLNLITRYADREAMLALDENTINELDENRLLDIDLIIHPYVHGRSNAAGATVKGYLKTLYAVQDKPVEFGGKYARFYEG